jgi:hypothetical protein
LRNEREAVGQQAVKQAFVADGRVADETGGIAGGGDLGCP